MKILFPVVLVLVGLLQIAGAADTAATNTVQNASQKKAPAKKKAPVRKHVVGKAPTRKPPVTKAPTKRAPVKKAPARRVTQYKAAPPVDPPMATMWTATTLPFAAPPSMRWAP